MIPKTTSFFQWKWIGTIAAASASFSFSGSQLNAVEHAVPLTETHEQFIMTPRAAFALITSEDSWLKFRTEILANPVDLQSLATQAKAAREGKRLSVVDKKIQAPSGDPHDYSSQAPYWWPDPAKPDGLPYIRRDGEVNPEFYGSDRQTLEAFRERFACLVLHAWATGDVESSRAAGRLLRTWFIDPATKMNPHLRYAQRIPGKVEGRGIGIIDTFFFCFVLDEVGRLSFNEEWTPKDLEALKAWFSAYLDWLLQSPNGHDENQEFNNHGTWYDAQVACFAIFCGREEIARQQIEHVSRGRLTTQIAADGSQPHELVRTLSLNYCTFNLLGFAVLAQAGRKVNVELWDWRTDGAVGLRAAINWMLPYYREERPWTWPQIGSFNRSTSTFLLSLAAQGTRDETFDKTYRRFSRHPWDGASFWGASVRKE